MRAGAPWSFAALFLGVNRMSEAQLVIANFGFVLVNLGILGAWIRRT